ncbi:hypothetical protein [Arcticibacter tournemirensis]
MVESIIDLQIKVSAIVVGRNEGAKLHNCFASLQWCDEILYADLNSRDKSLEIAEAFGCSIYQYSVFGPAGEYTQSKLMDKVRNEWVLLLDPDEVLSDSLIKDINVTLKVVAKDFQIGSIELPWQFYFGRHRLLGTVWGGEKYKEILVHRNRFDVLPITHYGRRRKAGFEKYTIRRMGENIIHHYWMDDISSFISKHHKYLRDEGRDRYNRGERVNLLKIILCIPYQFLYSYIKMRGYKDGFIGLFLSIFWAYYIFRCYTSLYSIARKI